MTIAPDTPTDIARRQRTLVTEAWGYTQRTRTVDDLPDPTDGWDLRGACRGTDPDLFIVTRGPAGNQAALRVCAGCRVIDDCRVDAVRSDDQATVRGHMLPKERNQWLKDQGIRRPSLPSASSQRPTGKRGSRRIPLDVGRIVRLRQGGATYAEIAGVIGCTPRTAHRRYVEWERQQGWCGVNGPTIGALCAGFGGLDLAVQDVLGGHIAWVAENDPAASKVLAHRFPGVPNLGDITRIDWPTVPHVDIVTAGFPCTDVSLAGRREGLTPDTRSGLWTHIAAGLAVLRPSLVIIENVRGLLSAKADRGDAPDPDLDPLLRHLLETADEATTDPRRGDLGPDDEDLGDVDGTGPVLLRALGAVLGDLADIGFDAEWTSLRAADVGCCHGRFRTGVLARPAADTSRYGRDEGRPESARLLRGLDAAERCAAVAADPGRVARAEADPHGTAAGRSGRTAADAGGPPRDLARHAVAGDRPAADGGRGPAQPGGRGGSAPGRAAGDAQGVGEPDEPLSSAQTGLHVEPVAGAVHRDRERDPAEGVHDLGRAAPVLAWGPYEAAIRRWEMTLGRPAPAPTEPGTKGQPRLSPRFVEWMQGCPEGWVTDVPELSRNDMLRILGNGVVRQQFAAVIRILLHRASGAVAA